MRVYSFDIGDDFLLCQCRELICPEAKVRLWKLSREDGPECLAVIYDIKRQGPVTCLDPAHPQISMHNVNMRSLHIWFSCGPLCSGMSTDRGSSTSCPAPSHQLYDIVHSIAHAIIAMSQCDDLDPIDFLLAATPSSYPLLPLLCPDII